MPTTDRTHLQHGRARAWLALLVALVGGGVAAALFLRGAGPLPDPEGCEAVSGGTEVSLSIEQAENAATIAAVAVRRGLPARAVSIALAAAFQESKLRNLRHGDRDSLGLFQQRPSQGWGTRAQILKPIYAANRFYDALVRVDGYETMRITEAAQAVQHSGFPEAYDRHAEGARVLASALTGYGPAGFTCVVHEPAHQPPAESPAENGLTPRAESVRADLTRAFGDLSLGGFAPGGVSTGHMPGSAHYDGRAVDVFVRPVDPANRRLGWAIAHYLVASAERLEVEHVIFDGRIWTRGRASESGWRNYVAPTSSGDPAVLEHRDHVHADVLAGGSG